MENYTQPVFSIIHDWPYEKSGKCDNCEQIPDKISRCIAFGWKQIYLCQKCEAKIISEINKREERGDDVTEFSLIVEKLYNNKIN